MNLPVQVDAALPFYEISGEGFDSVRTFNNYLRSAANTQGIPVNNTTLTMSRDGTPATQGRATGSSIVRSTDDQPLMLVDILLNRTRVEPGASFCDYSFAKAHVRPLACEPERLEKAVITLREKYAQR